MIKILRRILFTEIPPGRPEQRLLDLDAARGVAIVLVVIGHIASRKFPEGNGWYLTLMGLIYQFHMPLFMALTGTTFALSLPQFRSWREVLTYSARRVNRLFVPYLAVGLLVLVGKLVAVHFVHVDNPPASFMMDAVVLVLMPIEGVARFLWFIYVLSIYLMLVPALFHVIGRRPWLLLVAAVLLQLGSWTEFFMIDWAVYFLPFFAGGMVLWLYRSWWSPMPPLACWMSVLLFGGLLALSGPFSLPKWLVGAGSVLAVIGLVQRLPLAFQSVLGWLGKYSLSIYLFNELAMGVVKGLLFKIAPWDGVNFLFYFPLLLLVGIGIPLAIKYVATKRFPGFAMYF